MIDAAAVERATGWTVHHHPVVASTNDEALALVAQGAGARTVVVADAQLAGRGREGRAFSSPPGGLYASMLVSAGPLDLPGPVVAAAALAAADAVEAAGGVRALIKWPNDLWVGGRKLAGLLLQTSPGARPAVVIGVGVNVDRVPADLPPEVRRTLTALATEAGWPVRIETLLIALLERTDRRLSDLRSPASRATLAAEYAARLVLKGARVTWREGSERHAGTLLGASLEEGLSVLDDAGGSRWVRPEHASELRADGA